MPFHLFASLYLISFNNYYTVVSHYKKAATETAFKIMTFKCDLTVLPKISYLIQCRPRYGCSNKNINDLGQSYLRTDKLFYFASF